MSTYGQTCPHCRDFIKGSDYLGATPTMAEWQAWTRAVQRWAQFHLVRRACLPTNIGATQEPMIPLPR